jgi:glycosyltransferase involved in cell wall biosynthesis
VIPVFNEAHYVEDAIRTVLAQDYAGEKEVVLALGPSTDGTTELVEAIAAGDPRISTVRNPAAAIPVGMNRALEVAKHPIIVRIDAHSEPSPDYTRRAVAALERTGAGNVGGIQQARGKARFQRAVARAYNSRFGLGGGAYHGGGEEGPAESAYLGVFRRAVLDEVGGYDESLRRGEDWELNLRIRRAGHKVWFDPTLIVTYWPRENLRKLVRQFLATGIWRGELVRRHGGRNPVRFFIPPALLLSIVASLVVAGLQLTGVLSGITALAACVVYLGPIAYAFLLVLLMFTPDGGPTWGDRVRFLVVLPTMHLAWGAGFLIGLVRGARDAMDTSRLG